MIGASEGKVSDRRVIGDHRVSSGDDVIVEAFCFALFILCCFIVICTRQGILAILTTQNNQIPLLN